MIGFNSISDTYEVLEEIGCGGGGTVYRAYHKRLQKDVVIKKMHDEVKDIINSRAEADILKHLRHSYLPQVFDFLEIGNNVFTVMDFIPGKSFEQHLKEGTKFTQKQVIKWARQLTEALNYLHNQTPPIIHSDIKPANIMLTPKGDICLIDFNISSVFENKDRNPVGFSEGYSAPEQYPESMRGKRASGKTVQKAVATEKPFQKVKSKNHILGMDRTEPAAHQPLTGQEKTEAFLRDSGAVVDQTEYYDRMIKSSPDNTELFGRDTSDETDRTEMFYRDASDELDRTEIFHRIASENSDTTELFRRAAPENSDMTELFRRDTTKEADPTGSKSDNSDYPGNSEPANRNKPQVDERSDIYSLGATLYHLLTGVRPASSLQGVASINSLGVKLSDGLQYVIEKAMQPKPEKRFDSAAKLLKTLNQLNKLDKRYKRFMLGQEITAIIMLLLFAATTLSIYYGLKTMEVEKQEQYDSAIEELTQYRDETAYTDFDQLYVEAVNLYPDKLDAYYQRALCLYEQELYLEDIDYIENELLNSVMITESDQMAGDIYFILANCYFELEEYEKAAHNYKTAIYYHAGNSEYYRDYAIALARLGQTEEASGVLNDALSLGLTEDDIYLVKGEIDLSNASYETAADHFLNCIRITDSEYKKNRAYVMCSKTYEQGNEVIEGAYEKNIALLEEAVIKLPMDMTMAVNARLAETYVEYGTLKKDNSYYLKAIDLFVNAVTMGWDNYNTHNSLSLLYRMIGEYEKAFKELDFMLSEYGEHYNTYKRLAYLETDIQGNKINDDRDYTKFKEYYDKASDLYQEELKDNKNDTEMDFLDTIYQELVEGNWF
ncbi:MAG: Protein kinase domain [Herbinix sp.]|jgi:serine/threonine-protein kinase|nr:Protein kinase domain [Herbinix sp.]